SKIYFASTRDQDLEICSMNPDGTGQTNLTKQLGFDGYPVVSANGAKLAFLSDREGTKSVHVMDTATLAVTHVNADLSMSTAISPDGSKIYTVGSDSFGLRIGVAPASGGSTNYFLNSLGTVNTVVVSPDGTEIAYDENLGGV